MTDEGPSVLPWRTLSSRVLFSNWFIRVLAEEIEHPRLGRMTYYIGESPADAVAVVALTDREEILLTRQYRHPLRQVIFDLPAGRLERGEDPSEGARRELEEETGYTAGRIERLGYMMPYPGSLRVATHLYLARDLRRLPQGQHLDPQEEVVVVPRPFREVLAEVVAGKYIDGSLQYGVLMAAQRLGVLADIERG